MHKQTLLFLLISTWFALLPQVLAQTSPTPIELTPAERAWLATHPEIHLGIDKGWTPFVKLQDNGDVVGIEPDLLARINALTGANIHLVLGKWTEMVAQAERGELHGLAMSAAHPERAERFLFSTSHYSVSRFVYAPSNTATTLRSMEDLAGKRVGLTAGNLAETKLLAKWPKIIPVPLNSGRELAVALMNHNIDAAISSISLLRTIRDELLPDLTIAFVVPESETKLLYSIGKEYPELLSIINKALATMSPAEVQGILEKWGAVYNAPTTELVLTDAERAWLREHPKIVLGGSDQLQPYLIAKPDGSYDGLIMDYFNLLNQQLGNRLQLYVESDWQQVTGKAIKQEIDGLAISTPNPTWDQHFLYTAPYHFAYFYLYTRTDSTNSATTAADLAGQRVGYLAGAKGIEYQLRDVPRVKLFSFNSNEALVNALLNEQVEVLIGTNNLEWWRKQHSNFAFKTAGILTDSLHPMVMSIRNDWKILPGILNKALNHIPSAEQERIRQRWLSGPEMTPRNPNQITLSTEELAWLRENRVVHVRIGDFPPYHFWDNGPRGISVELLDHIAKNAGFQVEYLYGTSWTEALQNIRNHAGIDLFPTAKHTPDREEFLAFSKDYLELPWVIFTRETDHRIFSLEDLFGKTIAVEEGYVLQKQLADQYPQIKQVKVQGAAAALLAVSEGKVDAYIGNLPVAQYHIARRGISNLKVAASTTIGVHTQAFAVRKDWAPLATILDKGMAAIPAETRNSIGRKYFSLAVTTQVDYTLLLQLTGVALLIIGIILYWNRRLAKEITLRKQTEQQLQDTSERLRSILDSMDDLVFVLNAQGHFLDSYQTRHTHLLVPPEQFLGKHYRDVLPEPVAVSTDQAIAIARQKGAHQYEYSLQMPDGEHWYSVNLSARHNRAGQFDGSTAVVRDVTQRKQAEQQLQENQELLELVFNLNPDSTIITRLTDGIVIKVNEGFTTMAGFAREEVVGKQTVDIDLWENPEDRQHVIDELGRKGICENYEAVFKRKDGSRLVGIMSARLFASQGVPHVITVTRNITERKLAEQAMHDSQMRYQSLVDDIGPNFIVYSHRADGILEYVSKGMENIFGIPPTQAIGRHFGEIIPWQPDTLATSWEKVRHMLATGESLAQWRMYFDRPDGTTGTILVNTHPVKGEDGTYNRIEGIVEDITKRQQTELALRQSEERYHSVITAMAEGVVMQNRDGEIVECNAAAERILGLTKEQMRGRTSLDPNWRAVREDGSPFPGEEHPLSMTLRTGQPQRNVVHGVHQPNGELRWLLVNAEPLFQPGASIPYAGVATLTDVTDSRAAAQQIDEQRRTLQTVLDHLPAGVQVFSASTVRPLLANRQAQKLLGQEIRHTDIEKLNTHYGAFVYGTDTLYPPEKMPLMRALNGEISMVEDMELRRPDDSKILLQVIGAPIFDEKQTITAGVVIFLDITLRKQTELELIKARESAESANRAKSAFIANMSHELRTPLNAVLGFAQILQRDPSLGNHQREQVQRIQSGGEYLLTLINDILDLAKIEAGRFELFPETWDTRSVFQELSHMFRIRTEQKNLDFQHEPVTPLPYSLYCDHKRLRQILINLLGNAVKFTERGGVTLRTGYEAGRLWLEVVDSGIGIAAVDLGKIFEPFRQTGTDHYKMQGTGLGLAITHRLVQTMGGTLRVDSTLGQGSVFHVEVPAKAMSTTADIHSPVNQPVVIGYRRTEKGGPLRILGVDDLADNRRVLHQLLEPLGFAVEEAENGQHCLDLVPNYQPDVIFMDLRMPNMDGLQVTRALRAQGFEMPIIVLSASTFADDRAASLEAGCTTHLAKPVRLSEVLETLAQWLPLEWKYANTPVQDAVAEEQALETLSVEQAERIRNLNQIGDIVGLKKFARHLEASRPQLAKKLGEWVNTFEFDKIDELVEKSREA